jgi:hypothetical protein
VPPAAATLTVYRAGDDQEELVDAGATAVPLGLAVGQYDVRVTFAGSHDKPERWLRAVQIEDSDTLDTKVEFSSGKAAVEMETAGGGTLEGFEVYVYYYRAGDHLQPVTYTLAGETVVLAEGLYDVRVHYFRAHDQPNAWLQALQIRAGQSVTRKVVFRSGKVQVRAYAADGAELIGDNVFTYVYAVGQRSRPIARARSGEVMILAEGVYDIRVEDTRRANIEAWLDAVQIRAGELVEQEVDFLVGGE